MCVMIKETQRLGYILLIKMYIIYVRFKYVSSISFSLLEVNSNLKDYV